MKSQPGARSMGPLALVTDSIPGAHTWNPTERRDERARLPPTTNQGIEYSNVLHLKQIRKTNKLKVLPLASKPSNIRLRCMCAYIYTYVCVICAYIYIHIHIHRCTYTCLYLYICIHTHIYIYIYVYIYMYVILLSVPNLSWKLNYTRVPFGARL